MIYKLRKHKVKKRTGLTKGYSKGRLKTVLYHRSVYEKV